MRALVVLLVDEGRANASAFACVLHVRACKCMCVSEVSSGELRLRHSESGHCQWSGQSGRVAGS